MQRVGEIEVRQMQTDTSTDGVLDAQREVRNERRTGVSGPARNETERSEVACSAGPENTLGRTGQLEPVTVVPDPEVSAKATSRQDTRTD